MINFVIETSVITKSPKKLENIKERLCLMKVG